MAPCRFLEKENTNGTPEEVPIVYCVVQLVATLCGSPRPANQSQSFSYSLLLSFFSQARINTNPKLDLVVRRLPCSLLFAAFDQRWFGLDGSQSFCRPAI